MAVSDLFTQQFGLGDPEDELKKQQAEREKKLFAATKVGSPGKISTLMGYSGIPQQQQ